MCGVCVLSVCGVCVKCASCVLCCGVLCGVCACSVCVVWSVAWVWCVCGLVWCGVWCGLCVSWGGVGVHCVHMCMVWYVWCVVRKEEWDGEEEGRGKREEGGGRGVCRVVLLLVFCCVLVCHRGVGGNVAVFRIKKRYLQSYMNYPAGYLCPFRL